MQPMGNEKAGPPNFMGRPIAPPFVPPPPHTLMPAAPAMYNGPYTPPTPSSHTSNNVAPYQYFTTPQSTSSAHAFPHSSVPPPLGQPMLPPPVRPSVSQQELPPPVSFHPQSQVSYKPMTPPPPPQNINLMQQRGNAPQSTLESAFTPPQNVNPLQQRGTTPQSAFQSPFPPPQNINLMQQRGNAPQSTLESAFTPPQNVNPLQQRGTTPQSAFQSPFPPPQNVNLLQQRGNAPQSALDAPFAAPKATLYGYQRPANPVTQVPPMQGPTFPARQGGYAPPPPVAAGHLGLNSREQMRHPGGGPPMGAVQDLVEEFRSLSVGSVSGSIDPGIDFKALPRPLHGDIEPKSVSDMYPMNCASKFLQLTTSAIPNSQSLLSRWHLPLGAVVHPLAEASDGEEVPILNFGTTGIIRCRRCRTYLNPYVTFTDAGRKWRCNMCTFLNDVPGEYFAHLDASGRRIDADQRPELTKGSVDFVAPTEYMVRPPMPPVYFFLIDVSLSAVKSGMLEIVAKTIKSCLDELPGFPRTQIGFLTFDSTLHFYNMKSSLTQPQMLVVSDLEDIFVPLPDDLLVNLSESRSVVDAFLDSLPSMFQDNVNLESAFGPALKAAFMVMSRLGGKLLIFQSTLPSLGVGRLRLRGDDLRAYGTDKEHTLRIPDPENPFYKNMAADLTKFQIAVNLYAFSDKYTDLASLGTLAKYTGGQVYYYPSFQSVIHREKLEYELARDLTRETAWESVMRIRCSKGVRFTTYHGHFLLRSSDLLALPAVDCDKAFGMQLSLEDTLLTTQIVYFQVALLYTSSSGERRIRVHTAAAPVVADLGEMYRQADTGAIVSMFSRLAIEKTLSYKLEDARHSIQMRIVKAFKEYRNLYAMQHRLVGRMIYPESLKFLLLYGFALCKSIPLRGGFGDVQLDDRSAACYSMMTMPIRRLLKLLYPSFIRIEEYLAKAPADTEDMGNFLKKLPLASENLDSRGLFIYDDGVRFIIWFGRALSPDIANKLLGVDLSGFPDLSRVNLCEHDNEESRKLVRLLKRFRDNDPSCYQLCHFVRQGEQPREGSLLLMNLIEDQIGGTNGYVDWILQIHRQVQQSA